MPPVTSYTEDLELRLVKAQRQYETLKASAHAAVTHWLFTSGERFSLRLHYFEREHVHRGELLAHKPKSRRYYRYGLLADEEISVEEWYEKGKLTHEAFWLHTETSTQVIRFVGGRPVHISQLDYADGLPVLYRHYGYHREATMRTREVYTHWDSRLTTIKSEGTGLGRLLMEYHCIYTPQQELERIDCVTTLPGYMNTVYRAPIARSASAPSPQRQALVQDIITTLENAHITKQLCALMLNYIYLEYFPPLLVPLFAEDREAFLSEQQLNIGLIWNAVAISPEDPTFIELHDPMWTTLAEEFYELESDDRDTDPARQLLADIAHDLNDVDWTGKLNITDDFVVFSLDYEGDDTQERLAASVPQAKLDLLRARGLW